ncbi:MAG: hypothetical protein U0350_14070 [Caldilineaceae bacterium]
MPSNPQVVVGTPAAALATPTPAQYTYQNEFPADRSKPLPLYITNPQTAVTTRLGDDTGSAVFGTQNEHYLLWHFVCIHPCHTLQEGLYVYTFATQENHLLSTASNSSIHPKLVGDWVAFGHYAPAPPRAALYAANLQTHEVITLTHELNAIDASVNGDFGISSRLAAWYTFSGTPQIIVYDLTLHGVVATLSNYDSIFNEHGTSVFALSPGESVVTWSRNFGYDLVTGSYFRIPEIYPPNWDGQLTTTMSPITEQGRELSWTFSMKDGTQRYIKAPLIDATPSAAPCVEGQNLVQNGDLEDIAAHNLWQQGGSSSDLIVNDLPPNAPQAGQWAIRLGRYSNSQQTIQQTLNIPSNVKHITLAFDVRASSWDIWGGDQLQVDLIDPVTNQSILATPVQWTNRQLANGGWIPLQVDIQDWPGIDTPLYLVFRATTDWAFPTDFTLDNIRFLTACH